MSKKIKTYRVALEVEYEVKAFCSKNEMQKKLQQYFAVELLNVADALSKGDDLDVYDVEYTAFDFTVKNEDKNEQ